MPRTLRRSGAWLVRYALERLPVSHTFGIPGVHTTELYDELSRSKKIRPVLVTHEGGAAFMGEAVSRTSRGEIGVLAIVPAAGVTHAMSGIGEAFLDGIPLMVLSGGPRLETPFGFQLHELDSHRILAGLTKKSWKIRRHAEIVPAIFEAYRLAVSGVPGPVFIELPLDVQLAQAAVELPAFMPPAPGPGGDAALLDRAAALLSQARSPGLFVGWGAVDVTDTTRLIAEHLGAPVSTTLQGMSAFPGQHPLYAGMGFSRAAVPAARRAFQGCDCLLAVGTHFSEIPTGSYGARVPKDLIHIDIDPKALNRNYPARVAIEGDSRLVLPLLLERLRATGGERRERREKVAAQIARDRRAYRDEWLAHDTDRVNPARFFQALRDELADDAIAVVDDGNHTFLAAELFEVRSPRAFVSPTDFNCMGYAVPGAIGAKLVNPDRQVVGIVGDGSFLMTGLEALTAVAQRAGVVWFVFSDGALSQIAQAQEIPYNRKTCTVLPPLKLEGIATAVGAGYVAIERNDRIASGIREALESAGRGRPVVADVRIDYSKRTAFTRGVMRTVLDEFPTRQKIRFVTRALVRKVTG